MFNDIDCNINDKQKKKCLNRTLHPAYLIWLAALDILSELKKKPAALDIESIYMYIV